MSCGKIRSEKREFSLGVWGSERRANSSLPATRSSPMSSRDRQAANHYGSSIQATSAGVMRHGTVADRQRDHRVSHPDILENKMASQVAEIDQLSIDNRKLADSHTLLRDDLITAKREVHELRAHIRGIEANSDIQIRATLEKMVKMEAIVKNGENIRRELQLAHIEAQRLVRERDELESQVKCASEELKKRRNDAASLKEWSDELERLKKEHLRLRGRFEKEKRVNLEQVNELKTMEKGIMAAVKQIETLRSEVDNSKNNEAYFHTMH